MKTPTHLFVLIWFLMPPVNSFSQAAPYGVQELKDNFVFHFLYDPLISFDKERLEAGVKQEGELGLYSCLYLSRESESTEVFFLLSALEMIDSSFFGSEIEAYTYVKLAAHYSRNKRYGESILYALRSLEGERGAALISWLGYYYTMASYLDEKGRSEILKEVYERDFEPYLTPSERFIALNSAASNLNLDYCFQKLQELESEVGDFKSEYLKLRFWLRHSNICRCHNEYDVACKQICLGNGELERQIGIYVQNAYIAYEYYDELSNQALRRADYRKAVELIDSGLIIQKAIYEKIDRHTSFEIEGLANSMRAKANKLVYLERLGEGVIPVLEAFNLYKESSSISYSSIINQVDMWDASHNAKNSIITIRGSQVIAAYLFQETCDSQYLEDCLSMVDLITSLVPISQLKTQEAIGRGGELARLLEVKQAADLAWHQAMRSLDQESIDFDHMFALLETRNQAREAIIEQYPEHFEYNQSNWSLDIEELQMELKTENRSLLYLYLDGPVFYRYYFDGDDIFFLPRYLRGSSFEERISGYDRLLNTPFLDSGQQDTLRDLSREFYQDLLGDLDGFFSPNVDVIANGLINKIPLAALRSDTIGDVPEYFGDEHSINYHLSFQLREVAGARVVNPERSQVYALAPSFDAPILYNNRDGSTRKSNSLNNNKEEVEFIEGLLPGEFLFDSDASKEQFNQVAGNYSILHLATHAEANASDGRMSRIYFYGEDQADENLLYAGELPVYDINAEMVVLSACETGAGSFNFSQGLVGLTQSFIAAGAKSVVSTRWAVDDRATAEIMADFYTYLKEGLRKDESLRLAQRDYRERHAGTDKALPFYWAAFDVIGDPSPLEFKSDFYYDWWKWLAKGTLGLVVLVGVSRWRSRASLAA